MKKIEYCCDRCCAVFGGKGERRKISIERKKKSFKLRLFKDWLSPNRIYDMQFDELDLCEDCRKSFDEWLWVRRS